MDNADSVIHTLPWETIRAQQGDCRHVPSAIASLRSNDPAARKSAYWQLDNHIVVQGGLFEGAFYAIPFLLRLCSEDAVGNVEALELITEIAGGATSFENCISFQTVLQPFTYYVPIAGDARIPLVVACRSAVSCNLTVLIPNLFSDNTVVRKNTRDVVALFPEYEFAISTEIRRIAKNRDLTSDVKSEINKLINSFRL